MGYRVEKSSLLLAINGGILLLLGFLLTFLLTKMWPIDEQGHALYGSMISGNGETGITMVFIERLLEELEPEKRVQTLGDRALFERFVHEQIIRRSILTAAKEDDVLRADPVLRHRLQKMIEDVLMDAYLKARLDTGISAGFPYEGQMQEFYKQNQDRFRLQERIHVWQIFFVLPQDAPDKEFKQVMEKARAVVKKLTAKKIHFSDAAVQHSEHEPSRANNGYLGVFEISKLFPVLKETLVGLGKDEISKPVRSDTGIHILKRGAKLPAGRLSFEQVRDRIRAEMRTAALDELRKRILNELYLSYAEPVSEPVVEQWRMELRERFPDAGKDGEPESALTLP
uniref:Parvulin-like peptidyl-prolyl isomerase n=1 Tax=Candidatus Kentrum sp. FM TaxID=2126340 RepID=A0A450WN34_9GAMM|nr:MAG: Parvulin-like peptidyl-prolyl isomerase [Candidatus Kentron sp. FM]VFJ70311.1 MAG: Parvulin-like peptidyl-prolyl isomerase [Candidatus Kentron sp. FM]VFK18442.1 MAG: Parvulin-like peptidyl-prolyl isomerase [Candidatus Kentron sp. FM]